MKNYTTITTYSYKNETFIIVQDPEDGWYLAVNSKYVVNGKTIKQLNGLQLNASQTLNECIERVKYSVDLHELTDSGIDSLVATIMLTQHKTREEVEADEEVMNLVKKLNKMC